MEMAFKSFLLAAAAVAAISPARAALVVSAKPTKNVDCEAGVCVATKAGAILNVNDLAGMLAGSDVTLQSGSRAKDIVISAALDWASTHRLTLDSFRSITIGRPVTVNGTGAATLTTNDGGADGALSFGAKGKLTFRDTSSSLIINGAAYMLAADIATLAADFEPETGVNVALASDYDASADGNYVFSPIHDMDGNFEGLGNTISHFKLATPGENQTDMALIAYMDGTVSDLRLSSVKVKGTTFDAIGGLAGSCFGTVSRVEVNGTVEGRARFELGGICGFLSGTMTDSHFSGSVIGIRTQNVGGLAGYAGGTISRSYSTANVTGKESPIVGGLVGESGGTIDTSFATGAVLVDSGIAGGLVGDAELGSITNSYATGSVINNSAGEAGGLIGFVRSATTANSYASGAVAGGSGAKVGGLIGDAQNPDLLTDTYWDITTSGQSHGVGNDTGYSGVTGLTTEQFQTGLPTGFDPSIWAEAPAFNNGLPYLTANPQ